MIQHITQTIHAKNKKTQNIIRINQITNPTGIKTIVITHTNKITNAIIGTRIIRAKQIQASTKKNTQKKNQARAPVISGFVSYRI